VARAPCDGTFTTSLEIGDAVKRGDPIGTVNGASLTAGVGGVIRGLLRSNTPVHAGTKIGDIDPRGAAQHCDTISDKGRAIAGSVLEAILRRFNE
jgi:xanthine dehydrogenase accessory factor